MTEFGTIPESSGCWLSLLDTSMLTVDDSDDGKDGKDDVDKGGKDVTLRIDCGGGRCCC